jgi:cytochrome P450
MTLSDGTFIPKGTYFIAPSLAISRDPEIYPHANVFDSLRFYKMRARSTADENKYQLSSTSKTMMHFGAGRHACPGRVFTSIQTKMVLATIIMEYDLKLKNGEGQRIF